MTIEGGADAGGGWWCDDLGKKFCGSFRGNMPLFFTAVAFIINRGDVVFHF
jgi:hypothetical protein